MLGANSNIEAVKLINEWHKKLDKSDIDLCFVTCIVRCVADHVLAGNSYRGCQLDRWVATTVE